MQIKRVYAAPEATDGYRILVDRLWPRGLTKEKAAIDVWLKDVAPSAELRTWYGHDPAKFDEFEARYSAELVHNPAVAELKRLLATHPTTTLLYGAKDPHNQALVLQHFLEKR